MKYSQETPHNAQRSGVCAGRTSFDILTNQNWGKTQLLFGFGGCLASLALMLEQMGQNRGSRLLVICSELT